ncbi:hypothetical protein [Microbacterium sp. SS28]|uniref:hypothetical protein n=1 Tax=Microbacterium sp. SS28 TaxID=2919948 RepID=UPI001FAAB15A|nr:hypothetical protein [Microbacterium sp. SS28]
MTVTAASIAGCSGGVSPEPSTAAPGEPTSVERVDAATGEVLDEWTILAEIGVGGGFGSVVVDGDDTWVLNTADQTVSRIDAQDHDVTATIPFNGGSDPGDLTLASGGVWATDPSGDSISRVDVESNQVDAVLPIESLPTGLVTADGDVWVANHHGSPSASVWRIDAQTNEVVARIPIGGSTEGPQWLAEGSGSVWVGVPGMSAVVRIETQSNTPIATIPVPDGGVCGNLIADETAVWAASGLCGDGALTRIDPTTNTVAARIDSALWRAVFGGTLAFGSVWIATDRGIFEVNPTNNVVVSRLTLKGRDAFGGDLAADDRSLWIHDGVRGTVVRIEAPD